MCRVLRLSPSGYYDWMKRPPSERERRHEALQGRIEAVWRDSRETYGRPRIHAALRAQGERVSPKPVARLMKQAGIRGVSRRRWKTATTRRDAKARSAPDLVNRAFSVEGPDQLWVAPYTADRVARDIIPLRMLRALWSLSAAHTSRTDGDLSLIPAMSRPAFCLSTGVSEWFGNPSSFRRSRSRAL